MREVDAMRAELERRRNGWRILELMSESVVLANCIGDKLAASLARRAAYAAADRLEVAHALVDRMQRAIAARGKKNASRIKEATEQKLAKSDGQPRRQSVRHSGADDRMQRSRTFQEPQPRRRMIDGAEC
ncbi:MAG TPA: hypothetical protein VN832_02500 [Stellaceae bacterium]|nr:hypothetical protein [Stellaceae bacterium]